MNRIKEKYWWKAMVKDVISVIANYKECQENHGIIHKEHPARANNITFEHERIGIDLVSGLPETTEVYKGILVKTEYLTEFIMVYPIKSKGAEELPKNYSIILDYLVHLR